jgi:GT2 family glycosyltransferase
VYPPTDYGTIRCLLIRANPFAQSAIMVRRDAIETVGLYDEAIHYAEDYDLYLRLAQHWKLASVPEVLHQIRVHPASQTQRLENRICYFDMVARVRAIIRGQYPLSSLRHLVPTAGSMIVPLWLKRLRRRWRGDRYSYYRRPSTDPTWSGDAAHSSGNLGVNVINPGGENLPARRTRPAGADGVE